MDLSSFRQAGKEVFGKLCKGTVVDAYNRFTQPSIPTKTDSLLKTEKRKEGFGSSAIRFNAVLKKLPGPGSYNDHSTENPSVSKKGFGGLTNSAPRFKKFQYVTTNPGPGTYENKPSTASQGFKISLGKSKSLKRVQDMPAPGQYDPISCSSTKETTSVFKSTSKRLEENSKEYPAPWQYTPNYGLVRSSSSALTSVFKTPANVKRYQGNLYDPHAPAIPYTTPGPGEYNLGSVFKDRPATDSEPLKPVISPARPSSMFAQSGKDRFGKSTQPKVTQPSPAPGDYQPQYRPVKVTISGAVFMSESKREVLENNIKHPGPAFYKPMFQPKKKSFHLKPNNKWV